VPRLRRGPLPSKSFIRITPPAFGGAEPLPVSSDKKTRMEASAFSVLTNKGHLSYSINN